MPAVQSSMARSAAARRRPRWRRRRWRPTRAETRARAAEALASAHVRREGPGCEDMREHVRRHRAEPDDEARLVQAEDVPSPGAATASVTPVPKRARVDAITRGPSSRRRVAGGPVDVVAVAPVVASEAPAGARELQTHDRDEQHADEDVPGQQGPQREERQTLDGEQDQEDGRRRGGETRISLRAARMPGRGRLAARDACGTMGVGRPARLQSSSRR